MQTVINVNVPGDDAEHVKNEIKAEAQKRSMSVSQFLLWCWKKVRKERDC